jgi:hypothetical protein
MDPITTAIAAVGKLAEPAVTDAHEGLEALIPSPTTATSSRAPAGGRCAERDTRK